MASLTNSNAQKYRYLGQDESPRKPQAETLRDKILKDCLLKQLRTNGSLEEWRQNQKDFHRASLEHTFSACGQGLKSFSDFKELQHIADIKQVLRSSGLSEEDINLLCNKNKESNLKSPEAQEERLSVIKEKLDRRQQQLHTLSSEPEQFSGAVPLSRHEFENEINVIPSNERADKLTSCLIRLEHQSDSSIPADHPINHIKEIAEELFPSRIDSNENQEESKKRRHDSSSTKGYENETVEGAIKHVYLTKKPKTFWDMKEIPKIMDSKSKEKCNDSHHDIRDKRVVENKLFIQKQDRVIKLDPSKPFVLTLEERELIPLDVIESNRITLEKLREMDKFKNLTVGTPSKTLYVKNLSHKVSPHDLASLFGHFEPKVGPKILYRILNGRMRGQAFITFQDKDVAESALKTCNGYVLYEKPIVMEFSKK